MKALRPALTRVGAWLRASWRWLLGAAAVALALVIGGVFAARRLGKLRDEEQLEAAVKRHAELQGRREEISAQRTETAADAARVDARLRDLDREAAHQRALAVAAFEGGEEMSDEEITRAFREVTGG